MSDHRTDLEKSEALFQFLQGNIPDGYSIHKLGRPKLTADQAWTVIWYLGNEYWQVPDHIERCDICGELYDSHSEGTYLDFGKGPTSFCGNCDSGLEYQKKISTRAGKKYAKDNGLAEV